VSRAAIRDGKQIPVRSEDNKHLNGSISLARPGNAPTVAVAPTGSASIATTGKDGTGEPPLVVRIPSKSGRGEGARFYVAYPDDKARAIEMGSDAAVDAGVVFPSITTCIGSLDKPALVPWAAGLTADAAEERLRELQNMDPTSMAEAIDMLLEPKKGDRNKRSNINVELRAAHKDRKESAAERGTDVHALCEALEHGTITVDDVPEEYLGYVEAYQAFRDEYPGMQFHATEVTVAGATRNGGYMGTTDGVVEYNGRWYVLDLKTNDKATVYNTVGQQLAAAANATHIVHADGTREPMPPIDGGLAIGLGPDGTHKVFLFDTDAGGSNFAGFENSVGAWQWKRRNSRAVKPIQPADLD